MTRKQFLATPLAAAAAASAAQAKPASTWKPKRINKAIELLADKQPIYYSGGRGGYEEGKAAAQTHADYLNYEMEHGALDFTALRAFMQGLVDGGPTKSGHRTPAVIATLPVLGISASHMEANFWVAQQAIACGIHRVRPFAQAVPQPQRVVEHRVDQHRVRHQQAHRPSPLLSVRRASSDQQPVPLRLRVQQPGRRLCDPRHRMRPSSRLGPTPLRPA